MKIVYDDGHGPKVNPLYEDVLSLYNKRDTGRTFLHIEINDAYKFDNMCEDLEYPRRTKSILVCGPTRS